MQDVQKVGVHGPWQITTEIDQCHLEHVKENRRVHCTSGIVPAEYNNEMLLKETLQYDNTTSRINSMQGIYQS